MLGVESAITGLKGPGAAMSPSEPAATETASTETTASEVSHETPASEPEKPAAKPAEGDASAANAVEAPYQPNFKFKHGGKEHEFEDWAKPFVKDAATEAKLREMHQKAYGLDYLKTDKQNLKTELTDVKTKFEQTEKAIETIGSFAKNKDWDSFFEALSIPKEEILRYAVEVARREQDPQQKAQWESARQAQIAARNYEQQYSSLQQQQQQFQVEQRTVQLRNELSKPENSQIIETYNAGMENPSAFEEFVIRIGQQHAVQGRDIPVAEAVQEAVRHLKAVNPSLGFSPEQTQATPANRVVQPSGKPVIPNIKGRGTSAVKSTVRSIDDIRALAKEFDAR